MTMTIDKTNVSWERTIQGAWRLSTIHDNHLVTRVYIGYTKREAIKAFREELTQ